MIENKKEYNYAFDLLRIIAILGVLINHQNCYFDIENYNGMTLEYGFFLLLSIICKVGPPLFFAISGALLLGKEESFSYILKHRVLRFFILMVLCTILMMFRDQNFSNPSHYFFFELNWYLYAYMAYLFMLYFLRKMVQNLNIKEAKLFILLTFLFYTLTGIFEFLQIDINFLFNLQFFTASWASVSWHIIFPIAGYCLMMIYKSDEKKYFGLYFTAGTIFSLILSFSFIVYSLSNSKENDIEMLRQFFIYMPTLLIFYLTITSKKISKIGNNVLISRTIKEFSRATLCVFVIENHLRLTPLIGQKISEYFFISNNINSLINVACEFFIYSFIAIVLRRVPGLRKIL